MIILFLYKKKLKNKQLELIYIINFYYNKNDRI